MGLPRILVFEYFTGGGWPGASPAPALLAEGRAMLEAVLSDLLRWGGATVITTCDQRLSNPRLPADQVVPAMPDTYRSRLLDLAAGCQAALVIAPESGGLLASLSQELQAAGVQLLGSDARAIAAAADKERLYQLFCEQALPSPQTWRLARARVRERAGELGWPLVLKPVRGAGAEGVSLVRDRADLEAALALLEEGDCLLQRYVPGKHASVSLLASAGGSMPLSLNEQWVRPGIPFAYRGGRVPLDHRLRDRALALARQAVEAAPGLLGYVGVDLVLGEDEVSLIEINPRLTTSYIGLRQVTPVNLGKAIWEACVEKVLPEVVPIVGEVSFTPGAVVVHG